MGSVLYTYMRNIEQSSLILVKDCGLSRRGVFSIEWREGRLKW